MFFDDDHHRKEALQFLVDHELEGAAAGITKMVIAEKSLTGKQSGIFEECVVEVWLKRTCKRCGCEVEDCELIGCWENGGYCGPCGNVIAKDEEKLRTSA
jgi:hypothetical protein